MPSSSAVQIMDKRIKQIKSEGGKRSLNIAVSIGRLKTLFKHISENGRWEEKRRDDLSIGTRRNNGCMDKVITSANLSHPRKHGRPCVQNIFFPLT